MKNFFEKTKEIFKKIWKYIAVAFSIVFIAKTIANICDEFVNQLRVFSDIQADPINYESTGYLNTILFREMTRKTDTP